MGRERGNQMLSQEELDKCEALLADERFEHKEIVGVFTYGSQTLGLNNEDSDVDLLMMTVPTAKELFRNGRSIREHTASNNEKIVQYRLPGLMRHWQRWNCRWWKRLAVRYILRSSLNRCMS